MQPEQVWFLYAAIAVAKGSEVGRRVKPLGEFWAPCPTWSSTGGRTESRVWERDKER